MPPGTTHRSGPSRRRLFSFYGSSADSDAGFSAEADDTLTGVGRSKLASSYQAPPYLSSSRLSSSLYIPSAYLSSSFAPSSARACYSSSRGAESRPGRRERETESRAASSSDFAFRSPSPLSPRSPLSKSSSKESFSHDFFPRNSFPHASTNAEQGEAADARVEQSADVEHLKRVVSRIERDDAAQRQQIRQQQTLLQKQETLLLHQERQLVEREEEVQRLSRELTQLKLEVKERQVVAEEARAGWLDAARSLQAFKARVRDGAETRRLVEDLLGEAKQKEKSLAEKIAFLEKQCGRSREDISDKRAGDTPETDRADNEARPSATADADRRPLKTGDDHGRGSTHPEKERETVPRVPSARGLESTSVFLGLLKQSMREREGDEEDAAQAQKLRQLLAEQPSLADAKEVRAFLAQSLRRETLQVRLYVQQRRALRAAETGCEDDGDPGFEDEEVAWVEEAHEKLRAHHVPKETLFLLFSFACASTLHTVMLTCLEEGNTRWLSLLKEAVVAQFLHRRLTSFQDVSPPSSSSALSSCSSVDLSCVGGGDRFVSSGRRGGGEGEEKVGRTVGEAASFREASAGTSFARGDLCDLRGSAHRELSLSAETEGGAPPQGGERASAVTLRGVSGEKEKEHPEGNEKKEKTEVCAGGQQRSVVGHDPETDGPLSPSERHHPLLVLLRSSRGNWQASLSWLSQTLLAAGPSFFSLHYSKAQPSSFAASSSPSSPSAEQTGRGERERESAWLSRAGQLIDEDGNSVLHWACRRSAPEVISRFGLLAFPSLPIFSKNKFGQTPADLVPPFLASPANAEKLSDAAILNAHKAIKLWRPLVFEIANKASAFYRNHENEAAYYTYTEAFKLQSLLLETHRHLESIGRPTLSSTISLVENTAKLAFNKARSALRLRMWQEAVRCAADCSALMPSYRGAYDTAAEACELLLDWEGALAAMTQMQQRCGASFTAADRLRKERCEAQLKASAFQVLGVEKGASAALINRAFRKWSIRFHPDKASGLAPDLRVRNENFFKRLNDARLALLDRERCAMHLRLPHQPLYEHPGEAGEFLQCSREKKCGPTFREDSCASPEKASSFSSAQSASSASAFSSPSASSPSEEKNSSASEKPRPFLGSASVEALEQQREALLRSLASLERQRRGIEEEIAEEERREAARGDSREPLARARRHHREQEIQKLKDKEESKRQTLSDVLHELKRRHQESQGKEATHEKGDEGEREREDNEEEKEEEKEEEREDREEEREDREEEGEEKEEEGEEKEEEREEKEEEREEKKESGQAGVLPETPGDRTHRRSDTSMDSTLIGEEMDSFSLEERGTESADRAFVSSARAFSQLSPRSAGSGAFSRVREAPSTREDVEDENDFLQACGEDADWGYETGSDDQAFFLNQEMFTSVGEQREATSDVPKRGKEKRTETHGRFRDHTQDAFFGGSSQSEETTSLPTFEDNLPCTTTKTGETSSYSSSFSSLSASLARAKEVLSRTRAAVASSPLPQKKGTLSSPPSSPSISPSRRLPRQTAGASFFASSSSFSSSSCGGSEGVSEVRVPSRGSPQKAVGMENKTETARRFFAAPEELLRERRGETERKKMAPPPLSKSPIPLLKIGSSNSEKNKGTREIKEPRDATETEAHAAKEARKNSLFRPVSAPSPSSEKGEGDLSRRERWATQNQSFFFFRETDRVAKKLQTSDRPQGSRLSTATGEQRREVLSSPKNEQRHPYVGDPQPSSESRTTESKGKSDAERPEETECRGGRDAASTRARDDAEGREDADLKKSRNFLFEEDPDLPHNSGKKRAGDKSRFPPEELWSTGKNKRLPSSSCLQDNTPAFPDSLDAVDAPRVIPPSSAKYAGGAPGAGEGRSRDCREEDQGETCFLWKRKSTLRESESASSLPATPQEREGEDACFSPHSLSSRQESAEFCPPSSRSPSGRESGDSETREAALHAERHTPTGRKASEFFLAAAPPHAALKKQGETGREKGDRGHGGERVSDAHVTPREKGGDRVSAENCEF
ncbi:DnaJ domain-containing protein [Toxoplasma gondii VEG]|uniref:DnaJ domain-containing protein n=1 Tax=Toxoplasma gondii (strain ATCC 50861 / VEG) TaxID=432359 RepID=V4Z303_TOXGV|nr:DnaJ domain-containing protein [Toxoplasma gondii VEG]